jgi:hypothetical protein
MVELAAQALAVKVMRVAQDHKALIVQAVAVVEPHR